MEDHYKNFIEEQERQLAKYSLLIDDFIEFCHKKGIKLTRDNCQYITTIGVVATYPNLVHLLNDKIKIDKEELSSFKNLETEFKKEYLGSGYFCSEMFMAMAHPYFRRGHYENANFAPRFIDIFWKYNFQNNDKYIALDLDRVRINVDGLMYMEFDTWYGANFKSNITEIEDGIAKLRTPTGLEPFEVQFFFGNTYSLDIKWTSKDGIKIFQAEEFKAENSKIINKGQEYHPVKYVHAEFDIKNGTFRHFDGAIHLYTNEEYYARRDSDFNHNNKSVNHLKTPSQKLFKVNGKIIVEDWVELTSHYFTGNPLIFEYFEGKMPDHTIKSLKRIRESQKNKN